MLVAVTCCGSAGAPTREGREEEEEEQEEEEEEYRPLCVKEPLALPLGAAQHLFSVPKQVAKDFLALK